MCLSPAGCEPGVAQAARKCCATALREDGGGSERCPKPCLISAKIGVISSHFRYAEKVVLIILVCRLGVWVVFLFAFVRALVMDAAFFFLS